MSARGAFTATCETKPLGFTRGRAPPCKTRRNESVEPSDALVSCCRRAGIAPETGLGQDATSRSTRARSGVVKLRSARRNAAASASALLASMWRANVRAKTRPIWPALVMRITQVSAESRSALPEAAFAQSITTGSASGEQHVLPMQIAMKKDVVPKRDPMQFLMQSCQRPRVLAEPPRAVANVIAHRRASSPQLRAQDCLLA